MYQPENTVDASVLVETRNLQRMKLEGENAYAATEPGGVRSVADGADNLNGNFDLVGASDGATTADIDGVTAAMPSEVFEGKADMENRVGASIAGSAEPATDSVVDEQAISMTESRRSELL
ncbi:hypothetical protein PF004_g4881 [Phytophthora fragariae]|uniref:Uncharacterized protein n=2 Tax=Phytophthora fragariae TaxID=53985 RepID=A0A6G0PH55_9STRA|nr:hypothetical protein PF004_g4881 [Phytophthora fragariae]